MRPEAAQFATSRGAFTNQKHSNNTVRQQQQQSRLENGSGSVDQTSTSTLERTFRLREYSGSSNRKNVDLVIRRNQSSIAKTQKAAITSQTSSPAPSSVGQPVVVNQIPAPAPAPSPLLAPPDSTASKTNNSSKANKKKKQSGPRLITKTVLSSPYRITWPQMSTQHCTELISQLTDSLRNLKKQNLPDSSQSAVFAISSSTKRARSDAQTDWVKLLKRYFVFGVNEVSKSVENGRVRLVILAAQPTTAFTSSGATIPPIVVQHIPVLCYTRNVPCCCLPAGVDVGALFQMTSLLAFALRRPTNDGDDDPFAALFRLAHSKTPQMECPWIPRIEPPPNSARTPCSSSVVAQEPEQQTQQQTQEPELIPLHIQQRKYALLVRRRDKKRKSEFRHNRPAKQQKQSHNG